MTDFCILVPEPSSGLEITEAIQTEHWLAELSRDTTTG